MMTRIMSALITGFCVVAGCGIASDPATTDAPPTPRAAAEAANPIGNDPKEVAWHPSRLDAGAMLDNVRDFQGYVGGAEIAASGVLTTWSVSSNRRLKRNGEDRLTGEVQHPRRKDQRCQDAMIRRWPREDVDPQSRLRCHQGRTKRSRQ